MIRALNWYGEKEKKNEVSDNTKNDGENDNNNNNDIEKKIYLKRKRKRKKRFFGKPGDVFYVKLKDWPEAYGGKILTVDKKLCNPEL